MTVKSVGQYFQDQDGWADIEDYQQQWYPDDPADLSEDIDTIPCNPYSFSQHGRIGRSDWDYPITCSSCGVVFWFSDIADPGHDITLECPACCSLRLIALHE